MHQTLLHKHYKKRLVIVLCQVCFVIHSILLIASSSSDTLALCSAIISDCILFFTLLFNFQVSALLLLSQQEEMNLLEKEVNQVLQKKLEELQRNLSQVKFFLVVFFLQAKQLNINFSSHMNSYFPSICLHSGICFLFGSYLCSLIQLRNI